MSWQLRRVVWSRAAARALADLDRRDSRRVEAIRQHVRTYAATGRGDMRKLTGRVGEYRLRVGTWRVVFAFGTEPSSGEAAMHILRIDDRRDDYRS